MKIKQAVVVAAVTMVSMSAQSGWIYYENSDGHNFSAVGKSSEYNNAYLAIVFDAEDACDAHASYAVDYAGYIGNDKGVVDQKVVVKIDRETFWNENYYYEQDGDKERVIWSIGSNQRVIEHLKKGSVATLKYLDPNWDIQEDTFPLNGSRDTIQRAQTACWIRMTFTPEYSKP